MQIIGGPIPGQSLTKKPGNYPWDKPSKLNDVDEIIKLHLDDISKESSIDNILLVLERGLPLNVLVETYLTSKVMKGIHNIDISILFGAEVLGTKEKALTLLKAELKNTPEDEQDSGFEILEDMTAAIKEQPEEVPPNEDEAVKEEPPKGLMSRGN